MNKQDTEKKPEGQPADAAAAAQATTTHPAAKRTSRRPLAGFFIAGASLALLFGIAALKGRVKDDT
jgi:hypothetical protein